MGYRVRDYLVTIEYIGNEKTPFYLKEYKNYKILLIKGCATLNEVNEKIYTKHKMKKSEWVITKVERLKSNVEIVE